MKQTTRLRQAFEAQGFTKAVDAWRHHKKIFAGKVGQDLFTSNANGNREVSKAAALLYAEAFGHDPSWYLYQETAEDAALALVSLRSALRAYGVHKDYIEPTIVGINGFVEASRRLLAEQSQSDQRRDQSGLASPRRAEAPSRRKVAQSGA